jgi:hypothetical protein
LLHLLPQLVQPKYSIILSHTCGSRFSHVGARLSGFTNTAVLFSVTALSVVIAKNVLVFQLAFTACCTCCVGNLYKSFRLNSFTLLVVPSSNEITRYVIHLSESNSVVTSTISAP